MAKVDKIIKEICLSCGAVEEKKLIIDRAGRLTDPEYKGMAEKVYPHVDVLYGLCKKCRRTLRC